MINEYNKNKAKLLCDSDFIRFKKKLASSKQMILIQGHCGKAKDMHSLRSGVPHIILVSLNLLITCQTTVCLNKLKTCKTDATKRIFYQENIFLLELLPFI